MVTYFFHGRKYFASFKVLLSGKSLNTPATLKLSLLSSRMVLPMGSASPNNVFASEAVIRIAEGSFRALMFPFNILSENINGKLSSTHGPWAEIILSPTVRACPQLQVAMATFLK